VACAGGGAWLISLSLPPSFTLPHALSLTLAPSSLLLIDPRSFNVSHTTRARRYTHREFPRLLQHDSTPTTLVGYQAYDVGAHGLPTKPYASR